MPLVAGVDRTKLAIERNYDKQDPFRAMETFRTFRQLSAAMFRAASPADSEWCGSYGGSAGFTLAELVKAIAEHDADHRR